MKILLVDDDKLITLALTTIIESDPNMQVVATGHSADEAVRLYQQHNPDVALLDIRMGERTGLDATSEILQTDPQARIVFLTTFSDPEYIREALRLGSRGYLLKTDYENLLPAIRAVYAGQSVYGKEITDRLPQLLTESSPRGLDSSLTEKERDIMEAVARGLNNKEIAEEQHLSEGTVRNYISLILDKLSLRDRTQLAIYYLQHHP